MTTRVTIKNEDATRTVIVTMMDRDANNAKVAREHSRQKIEPGDTKDFVVYDGRSLTVEEELPAGSEPR